MWMAASQQSNKMIIRNAIASDSVAITDLLFIAMDEILYDFILQKNAVEAKKFLHHFVQQVNNQYSWENCFVGEINHVIVCAINIYSGRDLEKLRHPILKFVRENYNRQFNPEDETEDGEYYIDSFGVDPSQQGKGLGKKMLQEVIDVFVVAKNKTLGLLVDIDNPKAKELYLKVGFKMVGVKTLAGKTLEHLQLKSNLQNTL